MRRFNRGSIKNMIHGSSTVLDIHPKPVSPRGVISVFYKPTDSAKDAIKSDWVRVGSALSGVIERESNAYEKK